MTSKESRNFTYDESGSWLNQSRMQLLRTLIAKHVGCRDLKVLEIGAGIGENLPVLLDFGSVDANEISPQGISALKSRKDLGQVFEEPVPYSSDKQYDLIAAIEVIEHIEDDGTAIQWIYDHLKPGGIFLATIPAYQFLFSDHDAALKHYRRYNRKSFKKIVPSDFEILEYSYFNFTLFPLAVFSRFLRKLNKMIFQRGRFSGKHSSKLPNTISEIFKAVLFVEISLISLGIRFPFGVTLYCVARKPK